MIRFGNKILRKENKRVSQSGLPDSPRSLIKYMYAHNTREISAPQIGMQYRFFIMRYSERDFLFLDPTIVDSKGKIVSVERCHTVPGIEVKITRKEKIKMKYLDENMEENEIFFENEDAIRVQRMIDILDGILIIDYLSDEEYNKIGNKLNKILSNKKSESRRSIESISMPSFRPTFFEYRYQTQSAENTEVESAPEPEPEPEQNDANNNDQNETETNEQIQNRIFSTSSANVERVLTKRMIDYYRSKDVGINELMKKYINRSDNNNNNNE